MPAKANTRVAVYAFWGGVVGAAIALSMLLFTTVWYGAQLGLAPGDCIALGCSLTMMLSQPAAAGGMVLGVTVGVVVGAVAHYFQHTQAI